MTLQKTAPAYILVFVLSLAVVPRGAAQNNTWSVWDEYSSPVYVAVPAVSVATHGLSVESATKTVAFGGLTVTSWQMHQKGTEWVQRDLAATAISTATVALDAWEPTLGKWVWAAAVPIAGFYLSIRQKPTLYPKDPILHPAGWSAVALGGLYANHGWKAALPTATFAGAVGIRLGMDADEGVWHALWHLLSAATAVLTDGVVLNRVYCAVDRDTCK